MRRKSPPGDPRVRRSGLVADRGTSNTAEQRALWERSQCTDLTEPLAEREVSDAMRRNLAQADDRADELGSGSSFYV